MVLGIFYQFYSIPLFDWSFFHPTVYNATLVWTITLKPLHVEMPNFFHNYRRGSNIFERWKGGGGGVDFFSRSVRPKVFFPKCAPFFQLGFLVGGGGRGAVRLQEAFAFLIPWEQCSFVLTTYFCLKGLEFFFLKLTIWLFLPLHNIFNITSRRTITRHQTIPR